MPEEAIEVRGARVNNLKNISFSIPINQLTVVTGVSGSGKSSLAFDTIYAEGQRRYVESLSAYARQFLERMDKPDVDEVRGIAPAIAIRQKNSTRNPRSTVGTQTEVFDYLRLLYARVGIDLLPRLRSQKSTKTRRNLWPTKFCATLPEGLAFLCLVSRPGRAGGAARDTGTRRHGDGDARTERHGDTTSKRLRVPASPRTPRQVITAHVMSLMQRGFTRFCSRAGKTIELSSPDDLPARLVRQRLRHGGSPGGSP